MKPIGRVCNKHGFIFGGICEECRDDKINLILKKGVIRLLIVILKSGRISVNWVG
jgi:hypothetical protein